MVAGWLASVNDALSLRVGVRVTPPLPLLGDVDGSARSEGICADSRLPVPLAEGGLDIWRDHSTSGGFAVM